MQRVRGKKILLCQNIVLHYPEFNYLKQTYRRWRKNSVKICEMCVWKL